MMRDCLIRSIIVGDLALNPTQQFLVGQLLLLIVNHREFVGLQLVLLQLGRLRNQIGQLHHLAALGVGLQGLAADLRQLVNGLIVDLRKEFLGTQRLVAYLLDPFQIFRQIPLHLGEIILHLLHQLIKKHLHDSKIVFEFLHDLIPDIIIHKQFVLLLGKGLAVDLPLLESDVALVGDHALPFGEDQDEDFRAVEGDVELFHCEAVVDLEGEVVEEDCFVSLEQEPVFDLPDDVLLALSLLVLLGDGFVYVLLLGFVSVTGMHHGNLLVVDVVGQLQLLDYLLVLEVDLVHLGRHVQLVLGALLGQTHGAVDVVGLALFFSEELEREDVLPGDALFWGVFQHDFQ